MKTIRILSVFILAALFAASAFAADATPSTASTAVSVLGSAEFWTAVFALVAGLVAVWRHRAANDALGQLSTAQKITKSMVLGIEAAASVAAAIPAAKEQMDRTKGLIQAKAKEYGVQPVLHSIVQVLTEPDAVSN